MRWNSIAVLAALMMVAAAGAARPDHQFAKWMFAGKLRREGQILRLFRAPLRCRAHRQHPEQKVTPPCRLLVSAEFLPEDKALNYSFSPRPQLPRPARHFNSNGNCGHFRSSQVSADKMQISCDVDCDGGGMSVELAHADKSTLLRLDDIRIWQNGKPEEDGFDLTGGADDRVFRLDRAPLDDCRALITDRKELAAVRHK